MPTRPSKRPIDADDTVQIPSELAVLPVSDAVIFPYMMVPLVLSDADLLQLADDVLADNRVLGAFTQLPESEDAEDDDENPEAELCEIGTAVVIQKMQKIRQQAQREGGMQAIQQMVGGAAG